MVRNKTMGFTFYGFMTLMLLARAAGPETECAVLKLPGLTQTQINMITSLTHEMYAEATGDTTIPPVVTETGEGDLAIATVCFPKTQFHVPDIIDDPKYAAKYAEWQAEDAASNAAAVAIEEEAEAELINNVFCSSPLSDVEDKVNDEPDTKVALTKVNKCIVASLIVR